jgi:acyl-CoA thioester hydrolase/thioesterase-3
MKSAPQESAIPPETPSSAAPAFELPPLGRTRFTSQLEVRPDDIDMFQHVHSSRYLDYVLAARFEQMAQGYGMAMEEFLKIGYAWFQRSANIEFKRPLRMGDKFTVTTWIEAMERDTVRVDFEIRRADNNKVSCDGHCHYTLVNVATGRGEPIPDWIARKYAI